MRALLLLCFNNSRIQGEVLLPVKRTLSPGPAELALSATKKLTIEERLQRSQKGFTKVATRSQQGWRSVAVQNQKRPVF